MRVLGSPGCNYVVETMDAQSSAAWIHSLHQMVISIHGQA
jgi:hypothetical protein